jgi:hypothetical protein
LGEIVGSYSNPDGQSYGFLYYSNGTYTTLINVNRGCCIARSSWVEKTLNGSTNPVSGVIAVGVMSDWDAMQPMRLTPAKAADAP